MKASQKTSEMPPPPTPPSIADLPAHLLQAAEAVMEMAPIFVPTIRGWKTEYPLNGFVTNPSIPVAGLTRFFADSRAAWGAAAEAISCKVQPPSLWLEYSFYSQAPASTELVATCVASGQTFYKKSMQLPMLWPHYLAQSLEELSGLSSLREGYFIVSTKSLRRCYLACCWSHWLMVRNSAGETRYI